MTPPSNGGIAVQRITTAADLKTLRAAGLREAEFHEVTTSNRRRLMWLLYKDGSMRINIWPVGVKPFSLK